MLEEDVNDFPVPCAFDAEIGCVLPLADEGTEKDNPEMLPEYTENVDVLPLLVKELEIP